MVEHDCGQIAIVETEENSKPIGLIIDRDIACRVVAAHKDPEQTTVRDAMLSLLSDRGSRTILGLVTL
jgi:CBS domain-containing protein